MHISFVVIAFQQEKYIVNTLNSIKYQIEKYNSSNRIELIIADDSSSDKTFEKITLWCSQNKSCFENIEIISNKKNLGVAKNLASIIPKINGDYVKLLGGDDLLPFNNIFTFFKELQDYDIVAGIPLYFWENGFEKKTIDYARDNIALEIAYKRKKFSKRIEQRCFLNAPSLYLRTKTIKQKEVIEYLATYELMDDYPIWIKAAELNKSIQYKFINAVSILYRRTSNSINVKRNNIYLGDRLKMEYYLFKSTKNIFFKILHLNELICFKIGNSSIIKYGIMDNYLIKLKSIHYRGKAISILKEKERIIEMNKKYLNNVERKIKNDY